MLHYFPILAQFLPSDVVHKCSVCCHAVCLSVTFVYSVKMSNCILKLFPPPGRHIILVFPTKQYSDRNSPNEGVKCRGCEEIVTFDQYRYLTLSRK